MGTGSVRPIADSGQVLSVTSVDADSWDQFVAAVPGGHVAYRYRWGDVIRAEFGHAWHPLAAVDAAGEVRGVLPLVGLRSRLFGRYMVSMPYLNAGGALAVEDGVDTVLMDAASALARERGYSHVEFRDAVAREGWPCRLDKVAMELELPDSHEQLLKQVGAKVRSQTRRPVREGATAVVGRHELLVDFYTVFSRNMRDLGTPVYAMSFFRRVLDAFPDDTRIHVVRLGATPVAAGLVTGFGDRLEIPWASSLREYNRLGVNMFLYSDVLRVAIEHGYKVFDFGRSTVDAGTYRFKSQWGAQPKQLYWHYWLRDGQEMPSLKPDNPKFALAIAAWKRLPVGVANLLGPHVVRGLP